MLDDDNDQEEEKVSSANQANGFDNTPPQPHLAKFSESGLLDFDINSLGTKKAVGNDGQYNRGFGSSNSSQNPQNTHSGRKNKTSYMEEESYNKNGYQPVLTTENLNNTNYSHDNENSLADSINLYKEFTKKIDYEADCRKVQDEDMFAVDQDDVIFSAFYEVNAKLLNSKIDTFSQNSETRANLIQVPTHTFDWASNNEITMVN